MEARITNQNQASSKDKLRQQQRLDRSNGGIYKDTGHHGVAGGGLLEHDPPSSTVQRIPKKHRPRSKLEHTQYLRKSSRLQGLSPIAAATELHVGQDQPQGKEEQVQKSTPQSKTGRVHSLEENSAQYKVSGIQTKAQGLVESQSRSLPTPDASIFLPLTRDNKTSFDRLSRSRNRSPSKKTLLQEWQFVHKMGRKSETSSRTTSTETSNESAKSKSISTTNNRFQEIIEKRGALHLDDSHPPEDIEAIQDRRKRVRETSPPYDESEFKKIRQEIRDSRNEADVVATWLPLLKKYEKGYIRHVNQQFTNFPRDIGFNNGLSTPTPDYIQGYKISEFVPFPVIAELDDSAFPTGCEANAIALAHLAGEFKKRNGNFEQAISQAAYDAQCLIHARVKALASINKADVSNRGQVATFVSDGRRLAMYVHYAGEDESGNIVYHQWPLMDCNIMTAHEEFVNGIRSLRNVQDWAREQAESLRADLLQHWKNPPESQDSEHPDLEKLGKNNLSGGYISVENTDAK